MNYTLIYTIRAIDTAIAKLAQVHNEHIAYYDAHGGRDNERRLTGQHETASITQFSAGVASRACSIRIPRQTQADGKVGRLTLVYPIFVCRVIWKTVVQHRTVTRTQ